MAKNILQEPSKNFNDTIALFASGIEGVFDGQIAKETIYVKGGTKNLNGDVMLAEIKIATKLKQSSDYYREYDEENSTHLVRQTNVCKDSFVSGKNFIGHKITFKEKQSVEIRLEPNDKAIYGGDKHCIAAVIKHLGVGVGLSINTDGVPTYKKNKIKIDGASKVEIFIKVTTGLNPISQKRETDENRLLENLRGQMYLMESELFDVLKMKHLMDIDKLKIME